jgi:hypothetical protein
MLARDFIPYFPSSNEPITQSTTPKQSFSSPLTAKRPIFRANGIQRTTEEIHARSWKRLPTNVERYQLDIRPFRCTNQLGNSGEPNGENELGFQHASSPTTIYDGNKC